MGELLFIDVAQKRRDERLQALWDAYNAARERAQASGEITDGILAGKAWAAWLDAFRAVNP
jgi:hypothetical protein